MSSLSFKSNGDLAVGTEGSGVFLISKGKPDKNWPFSDEKTTSEPTKVGKSVSTVAFGPDGYIYALAVRDDIAPLLHRIAPQSDSQSSSTAIRNCVRNTFFRLSQLFLNKNDNQLYLSNRELIRIDLMNEPRTTEIPSLPITNLNHEAFRLVIDSTNTFYTTTDLPNIGANANGGNTFHQVEDQKIRKLFLIDVYVDLRGYIYVISSTTGIELFASPASKGPLSDKLHISTNRGRSFTQHNLNVRFLRKLCIDEYRTIYIGNSHTPNVLMVSKYDGNSLTSYGATEGLLSDESRKHQCHYQSDKTTLSI